MRKVAAKVIDRSARHRIWFYVFSSSFPFWWLLPIVVGEICFGADPLGGGGAVHLAAAPLQQFAVSKPASSGGAS